MLHIPFTGDCETELFSNLHNLILLQGPLVEFLSQYTFEELQIALRAMDNTSPVFLAWAKATAEAARLSKIEALIYLLQQELTPARIDVERQDNTLSFTDMQLQPLPVAALPPMARAYIAYLGELGFVIKGQSKRTYHLRKLMYLLATKSQPLKDARAGS